MSPGEQPSPGSNRSLHLIGQRLYLGLVRQRSDVGLAGEGDVVRQRAVQAAEAIKVEREAAAQPEGEHVAPAILSALITRVASIDRLSIAVWL